MSTPPTIHDSDRKAGKECSVVYRSSTPVSYYAETMTLIIARHHAEERADAEKAKAERALWAKANSRQIRVIRGLRAKLTALRTASQSPTEGKT